MKFIYTYPRSLFEYTYAKILEVYFCDQRVCTYLCFKIYIYFDKLFWTKVLQICTPAA